MSEDNGTEEQTARVAIGIAIGNTNSSIAFTNASDGKAEVIANEEGDRQIPSILSYVAGEEFTGTQAKVQIVRNPRNTIAFFRDFLGKNFKDIDPTPCHASAHPVELEGGKATGFVVQEHVASEGEGPEEPKKSTLSVSETTTRLLRRLKQSATDFLGKEVSAVVITVPSDFSESQQAALSAAASGAGLEVLQFIPESVSALLAHDAKVQQDGSGKQKDGIILVADLGGTRSDVAVLSSKGGMYTMLSTTHDYELGGSSLDKVLVDFAAKEFMKKNKNASDPRENERSLAKLTLEAEAVRKALSLSTSASFSIESLSDGIDFNLSVNRTRYELLANKVFMSISRLIDGAVQKADLDLLDIDTVLFSGGTSHTPKIASNLQAHFPEGTVVIAPSTSSSAVNPSELAARGAAIQASLIAEFDKEDIEGSTEAVVTVTPHLSNAIGLVSGSEGSEEFAVLIDAETPVPVRRTAQIPVKNGGDVLLRLAEGVREIKVSKADKAVANGSAGDDDDDEDEVNSDDEPDEVRSKVWKPAKIIAETAVRGVKKNGKVEVQVNVAVDLAVTIVCREVGAQGGVRGNVEASKVQQNGKSS